MFKALANDIAGQMQKEIKSSNFSPAKYKLKNLFYFQKFNSVFTCRYFR